MEKPVKINSKIFQKDVEQIPNRKGFGEGLLEAGVADKNVVALSADLTESTQVHLFANRFPERFIQVGIAEQNLASIASGLAAMGKIPFISSYAMFSPGRNWEQIRTTIAYNNVNVKIIGSHAGVTVGPDGGTHQALEDIALARVIPNMIVLSPCDYFEARKATVVAAKIKGPVYIRLAREKSPVITSEHASFEIGKAQLLFSSDKKAEVGIVATGDVVYQALVAAKNLSEKGIGVKVLNLSTIKPIDEKALVSLAEETGAIITVEDHQVAGGMGSAVAECLVKNYPVPMEFIGVQDEFGQSGTSSELIEHYGLDAGSIEHEANKILSRKKVELTSLKKLAKIS